MPMIDTAGSMSLPEAARALSRSWGSCYAMLLRGQISGQQIGGRWIVERASVERLARDLDATPNRPSAA